MTNSLRNPSSLASNFPVDCQIPHLENNPYIYGGGPPYKPQPCRYSPPRSVPHTEKLNQQDFGYSELYSSLNSKGLRSTNLYSTGFGFSNSPSKEKISSFRNENKAETLKSSLRKEEAISRTPKSVEKNLKYEEVDYNVDYSKPREWSGGVSYRSQEAIKDKQGYRNKEKMEEYHLLSSGNKNHFPEPNQEKFQRKEEILSELHPRTELEYDELRRLNYLQGVEEDRKHDEFITAWRKSKEESEREQEMKFKEHYENLQNDLKRREQAFFEYHQQKAKKLQQSNHSPNIHTPNSLKSKSSHPAKHEELKQQIGRESRQFYRGKQMKNSPHKTPEHKQDYSSPQSNPRENNFTEPESQKRGKSSKGIFEKIRSLYSKKNDAHHFQPTFSTKVKSMANQPYTFANSKKSTVSKQS